MCFFDSEMESSTGVNLQKATPPPLPPGITDINALQKMNMDRLPDHMKAFLNQHFLGKAAPGDADQTKEASTSSTAATTEKQETQEEKKKTKKVKLVPKPPSGPPPPSAFQKNDT